MIAAWLNPLELVFGWLCTAGWQASLLALLVLLLQTVLQAKLNPRWRYSLWMLVLVRLLLPFEPECSFSLFQFAPLTPSHIVSKVMAPIFVETTPTVIFNPHPSSPISTPAPVEAHPLSLYSLGSIVWLIGAMTMSILTWLVNRRFTLQVKRTQELSDPVLLSILDQAKRAMGISRKIRVIASSHIQSPAITGLWQPTVLLPPHACEDFDVLELRLILFHELAHLRRGDLLVQALIAFLQILHWFNPVLWYAFHRIRIDREPATDALVLSEAGEGEKERYGLMLIKLLEHFNQRLSLSTLVGVLEDRGQFKRRFSLIARFTHHAYGWSVPGMLVFGFLAMIGLTKQESFAQTSDPLVTPAPTPSSNGSGYVTVKLQVATLS